MTTQLIKGNNAVIVGALYAGCDCFFGYPITPASEILHAAAKQFPKAGRQMVQAESEEASINMVYGAAATGRRVMTASSGPGTSLMQEGFSYLAGAQLPAVFVDVMRAGPGLGNIGPEQGDYNQVVKGGGHGNYRNIVLAPATVQEMCDFTMKAFELSQKWRMLCVVLADGVLGQMIEPLRFPEKALAPATDTSWAVDGTAATRGLITLLRSGISHICAHTNLDCAPGGVNDVLAEALQLREIAVLDDCFGGMLRWGTVREQPLNEFLQFVKDTLRCDGLRFCDGGKPVRKVAVGGGGCADALQDAVRAGCDTLVTSDIKYNQFWDARDLGLNIIDAGHFHTENPVVAVLAAKLQAQFPATEIKISENHWDCVKFFG